jgi:hypothetical protein
VDWKALLRDKRAWAVAGIGGALGIGLATKSKKNPSTAGVINDGTAPAVGMGASTYDSSLGDIWEGFNQVAYDLQQQINEIGDQLNGDTPPTPTNPAPTLPKPKGTWKAIKVKTPQTLYQFAQGHGGTFAEIVKQNPWLKGKKPSYRVKPGQIIKVKGY